MKEISIKGQVRSDFGKKASRDIRRDGLVPCVIYGVEKTAEGAPVSKAFTVSMKELVKVIYTPNVYIVNIDIDGQVVAGGVGHQHPPVPVQDVVPGRGDHLFGGHAVLAFGVILGAFDDLQLI